METTFSADGAQPVWHICWQAAKGRNLLVEPSLAESCRSRILAAHAPEGRHLLHYLLMPSELHVLSSLPAGVSPQLIAREIASLVSRWVREVDRIRGPVFAARYHAHAISTLGELSHEVRMLAWRPVAMGLCARPSYYRDSSLRAALGLSARRGFEPAALLRSFGSSILEAREAVRRVVRGRPPKRELREWELTHALVLATGGEGVSPIAREVSGVTATLVAAGGSQGIEGAVALLECWVAHQLNIPPHRCLSTLPGVVGVRARALVACLAVQAKLCSAAAIARRYKRAKATLCEQMAGCRKRPEDRHLLATPIASIVKEAMKFCGDERH